MPNSQYANVERKSNLWPLIFIVFVFCGLIYAGYLLLNREGKSTEDTSSEKVVDLSDGQETGTTDNEPVENETSDPVEETDETPVVTGDFSEYSVNQQATGEESETEFALNGVTDTSEAGFHKFVFEIEAKDGSLESPYVVAKYVSSVGAVRLDLNMMTSDSSGIGYQKAREINKEGVVRLYHNVSSDQTEEIYDVGVASETTFYLYADAGVDGVWNVTLEVKYPGESDVTIDAGSSDFSSEAQSIDGAGVSDGAKVTAYSYTASGGILRVVFSVAGNTAKPIPSATAGYDGSDTLILRFTEIATDTIAKMPSALTMPGGVTMVWEMDGANVSKYTFDGATKDFKLSAGTNPNQVIMEIKL